MTWMGLHNPDRHAPTSVGDLAWCNVCDSACYTTAACCCCLAAEVKRLAAELAERERRIAAVADVLMDDKWYVDVGEHADQNEAGELLFVEVADILAALRGECDE